MLVSQISVFVDNSPGRVEKVTYMLARENIKIKSLVIADSVDFSIVRIIVDDTKKALDFLKKEGFTASKIRLIGVRLDNFADALNRVFNILSECSINLEYGYTFRADNGNSYIILRVLDTEEIAKTLQSCGLTLLSDEDLCEDDKK